MAMVIQVRGRLSPRGHWTPSTGRWHTGGCHGVLVSGIGHVSSDPSIREVSQEQRPALRGHGVMLRGWRDGHPLQ